MGGCLGSETRGPETTSLLQAVPRVTNSPSAPCVVQKEIAAQNSYLDTVLDGVEKVYKAPCEIDKPSPPTKPARSVPASVAAESAWHGKRS